MSDATHSCHSTATAHAPWTWIRAAMSAFMRPKPRAVALADLGEHLQKDIGLRGNGPHDGRRQRWDAPAHWIKSTPRG